MRPPIIPDHTLLRPIGRGAYGEVWLARNLMGTPRAVKVIWRRQFESARPFEREFAGIQRFEPVSRSSGGLVHVLHVGKNDKEEYFYYVMELADNSAQQDDRVVGKCSHGSRTEDQNPRTLELEDYTSYQPRTLRSDLKRLGRLPTSDCLRVAIEVASGLGQLHRHGLVHRDVKPGNIIYVNGRAKLADIGLVTADGEGGTFVGTEGYIPPEGPGSPLADIYALGVVLYEASTGLAPDRFPDVPTEWFTDPAGDQALELHEIILKACEGQRERRYAHADAMQADLALLQSGQSVRHTRALQRRYARLRLSGMIGTSLLVLSLGAALLSHYRARVAAQSRETEARLRQQAQQAQAHAESAEREARRQLEAALHEEARALVLSKELGHRERALHAIRQAAGSTNAAELRRVAFAALSLPDLRLEREIVLPNQMELAQLDPRLERIALAGPEQPVTIYSLPDLRVLATLKPSTAHPAYEARWSSDGRFLALERDAGGGRGDLEIWNVDRGQMVVAVQQGVTYGALAFHPRESRLMVARTGGSMSTWDLDTGEEQTLRLPAAPSAVAYSPDGERFAASYPQGSNWVVAVHDASGQVLSATESQEPAGLIAWHPRGHQLAIVGRATTEWGRGVWLIGLERGTLTLLGRHKIRATHVSFSRDGNYLMSCGWDRELLCWDLRTQKRVFTFSGSGYGLDWSTDGSRCATIPKEHRLRVFAFEPPLCLELTGNRVERLGPGVFSPDGRFLAVPDSQNLCVWDLNGSPRPALLNANRSPVSPFFSTNGSRLFAVSARYNEPRLDAWQISPGSTVDGAPQLTPLAIAVPPNLRWADLAGNELVLTCEEGVRFLPQDKLTSTVCRALQMPPGQGTVSPDGRWLGVSYSFSPWVTVYRLPEARQVARFATSQFVAGLWFAPTGDELTVINRGGVEQWDTTTWTLKARQPGSPVSDSYVLYTPDGTGVWRVTNFRDTALLDRHTLEPILPLPPNVIPLAVSHDGRRLAVSVDDQRVQVWDLPDLRAHFRELSLDWGMRQNLDLGRLSSAPGTGTSR